MDVRSRSRSRLRFGDRAMPLDAPESLLIGRGKDCDVMLDDPSISRRHARVVVDGNGAVVLEDLGSVHGVSVNGALVHDTRPLSHGDRIAVGKSTLVLVDAGAPRFTTSPRSAPQTRDASLEVDVGALESALEADDRPRAETIATRAATRLMRGDVDAGMVARVERALATLGETDAFWLDRLLDLRGAHGSIPDAAIATRLHALARAGQRCTPEVVRRYLDAVARRATPPTNSEQLVVRRVEALLESVADG